MLACVCTLLTKRIGRIISPFGSGCNAESVLAREGVSYPSSEDQQLYRCLQQLCESLHVPEENKLNNQKTMNESRPQLLSAHSPRSWPDMIQTGDFFCSTSFPIIQHSCKGAQECGSKCKRKIKQSKTKETSSLIWVEVTGYTGEGRQSKRGREQATWHRMEKGWVLVWIWTPFLPILLSPQIYMRV